MSIKQGFRVTNAFAKINNSVFSVVARKIHVWNDDKTVNSPYKDVVIPETTLAEYVWQVLDKHPTKTATICAITKRHYTFEQIYKQSQTLGANLRRKFNIQDGDTVAVLLPNIPEYPTVVFGILNAGGIVTTLNPIYTAYEVQRQIQLSEAKLIVTLPELVTVVNKALELAKVNIPVIAVNTNQDLPDGTVSYKELVEDNHVDLNVLKQVKRNVNDVAFLPYSSGTTGLPKGVELTNKCLVANLQQQTTDMRMYSFTTETNQDSVLAVLPIFHVYGLSYVMLQSLTAGLKLVTLPKFQPDTFLHSLLEYKINNLYLAPPMVLFLGSHPQATSKHLESLRVMVSGAAPLSRVDLDKLMGKVKHEFHFTQGYGMTEASPLVTISPIGSKEYETSGFALPNIQLRVVDGDLKNLGPGEVGELLIKGPNLMRGYKNNPEANKEVFVDNDWYRSGDLVSINDRGLVTIADRLKELIKVKGYQVPPAELENVVKENPVVADAAVIGAPDPQTGERPKAFVVLKEGSKATEQDIINFVSERVAPYKKIKEVVFLDNIPKNPSGKILRRVLKEKYC
ncbi:uncharacterized protein LOC113512983 [Galleria mellonella]|uniref:Uncharacterized protein LOC113512983 n=1 Tax=Galleria mellonella TaxID=7137 RepID=A0ABM3MDY3_GALME|nr:uncharacterized protein LOC113512983 [Galleria mellonella]